MPLIKIIKKVLFAMHRKPKIPIGSFALIVLSLSLLPLIACNTAIGRAIGGDSDDADDADDADAGDGDDYGRW